MSLGILRLLGYYRKMEMGHVRHVGRGESGKISHSNGEIKRDEPDLGFAPGQLQALTSRLSERLRDKGLTGAEIPCQTARAA